MAGTQPTEQAQDSSFKEQLDRVAEEKRMAEAEKNKPANPIVEKSTLYQAFWQ